MQIKWAGSAQNKIPWWVWSIILLSLTGVLCYKIVVTPFNMQFDFSSFLSLLLALFSVGLAALFYFKATETSNAFYDNTYKFSQEVGALLAKIESGFGEKLTHLDDAYRGMRDTFDQLPLRLNIVKAEEVLAEEEKEVEKIQTDKDQIIGELLEKTRLDTTEKHKFIKSLREKDRALWEAYREISELRNRINQEFKNREKSISREFSPKMMIDILHRELTQRIGEKTIETGDSETLIKKFNRAIRVGKWNDEIIETAKKMNLIDQNLQLTEIGLHWLKGNIVRY